MPRWFVFVLIVWTSSASAFDHNELAALLEEVRVEMKMPGVRAAVRLPDGEVIRAAVGVADVEADTPLDDTIGMPGGSTGKTYAAALAMLLVEDGALSLDDPLSKWLKDEAWYERLRTPDEIRVRHLLSHSSGVADYPGTARFQTALVWRALRRGSAKFERDELIGFALRKRPLFPPGEGFAYTDAGYLILGRVIEIASGRDYYALLEERILAPRRLHQTRPQDRSVLPDITPGYSGGARNLKKDGRMKFDPSSEWTGGGLVNNPTMLVRFIGALANGEIVERASLVTMLSAGWRNPETPGFHYGFGLFVYDGGTSFGHGGRWPGYRSQVTHLADRGITIAVQTNRDGRISLPAVVERIALLVP